MIYGFNYLILDITDDELNIVRNVWNMFLITVKAFNQHYYFLKILC